MMNRRRTSLTARMTASEPVNTASPIFSFAPATVMVSPSASHNCLLPTISPT